MMRGLLSRLQRSSEGAAIVEFALIAPTLCLMLIGLFDMAYNMYTNTQLNGAVQTAARNSSIEGATASIIDARVTEAVQDIAPDAELSFNRTAYSEFTDVSRPEDFSDVNGDGACNDGEPFEDRNGNGIWDPDRGIVGQGNARDAILYEVVVEYPRAFPLAAFIGISPTFRTSTTTVLRNQPFSETIDRAGFGNCG